MPEDRFTETPFKPYVIAIGQLTLAWNDLHEKLARCSDFSWTIKKKMMLLLMTHWQHRKTGMSGTLG